MRVTADDSKTVGDAYREYEAQFGPGSPGEFVRQFLGELWAGHYAEAGGRLDAEYGPADLPQLADALGFITEPGWGWSGRPRLTPEGDESVRRIFAEGMNGSTIIDKPMLVLTVEFVVRHGGDGWRLVRITAPEGRLPPQG